MVFLAEVGNLVALEFLMYQTVSETVSGSLMVDVVVVALMGSWTVMGLMAGNVNPDATFSAASQRCVLT